MAPWCCACLSIAVRKGRGTLGPCCMLGGWQHCHWLKTGLFCPFSILGWTHLTLFVPRSKAALELYNTWIGDCMENRATVGRSQGLKDKCLVNTRPQTLDVFCLQCHLRAAWKFTSRTDLLSLETVHLEATSYAGRWVGVEAFQRRRLKKLKPLSAVIQLSCLWNHLNTEGRWAKSIPYRLCRTHQWLFCPARRAKLSGWRKEEGFLWSSSYKQVQGTVGHHW